MATGLTFVDSRHRDRLHRGHRGPLLVARPAPAHRHRLLPRRPLDGRVAARRVDPRQPGERGEPGRRARLRRAARGGRPALAAVRAGAAARHAAADRLPAAGPAVGPRLFDLRLRRAPLRAGHAAGARRRLPALPRPRARRDPLRLGAGGLGGHRPRHHRFAARRGPAERRLHQPRRASSPTSGATSPSSSCSGSARWCRALYLWLRPGVVEAIPDGPRSGARARSSGCTPSRSRLGPMLLGGLFLYLAYYGCDQSQAQRLLTARDDRAARRALLLHRPAALSRWSSPTASSGSCWPACSTPTRTSRRASRAARPTAWCRSSSPATCRPDCAACWWRGSSPRRCRRSIRRSTRSRR